MKVDSTRLVCNGNFSQQRFSRMKLLLTIFLLTFSCGVLAEWIEYSSRSNGDVFFFDDARVEKSGNEIRVWTRIRYKTSVMAASSYQSLLRLDCAENSETVLQSTFFTDKDWAKPAMATNTHAKPKKWCGRFSYKATCQYSVQGLNAVHARNSLCHRATTNWMNQWI